MEIFYKVTFDENDMVIQVDSSKTQGDGFEYYTPKQVKLLEKYGTTKQKLKEAATNGL